MKRVGVREFRDHATRYLAGDEVIAVERHGRPVGFYIPAGSARRGKDDGAMARLEETVRRVLEKTGMSEEELSRLFDVNQPLPDQFSHSEQVADAHVAGR